MKDDLLHTEYARFVLADPSPADRWFLHRVKECVEQNNSPTILGYLQNLVKPMTPMEIGLVDAAEHFFAGMADECAIGLPGVRK